MENQEKKNDEVIKEYKKNYPLLFWIILGVSILSVFAIVFYIIQFPHLSSKTDDWGTFSTYVSGVIGTIFTIAAFGTTLYMITKQREEFNKQLKIIHQEQFEITLFNMLELLCNYSEKNYTEQNDTEQNDTKKNNQDIIPPKNYAEKYYYGKETITEQCCRIIVSLFTHLNDFLKDKAEHKHKVEKKYVNFIKANLYENLLIAILDLYNQMNLYNQMKKGKLDYPYDELKITIEEFSLLELVSGTNIKEKLKKAKKNNCNEWDWDFDENYSKIIQYFELSAFGNNLYLLKDRIKFENDPEKLKKYITHPDNTVRQAAINTINFLKSQNDENK